MVDVSLNISPRAIEHFRLFPRDCSLGKRTIKSTKSYESRY